MTADKKIKTAWLVTLAVMLFQLVDVFLFNSHIKILSGNICSQIISLIFIIIFSRFLKFNLRKLCFDTYGWYFEILYGAVFSITPIAIVYLFKFVYFHYRGYENLELTFNPPGLENIAFDNIYLISLFYAVLLLLVAFFKEIFYRGYLITQLTEKFGVNKSIFIQAFIYLFSFVPTIIFYFVKGQFEFHGPLMSVFLICGHLFLNLLSGIKWGVFYKINGTVWMSVADHFINNFLTTSLYFTEHRLPEKWILIELIAIQLLSIAMFVPFYYHRDRMNKITAEEIAVTKEAMSMTVDNYTPSIVRKKITDANGNIDRIDEEIFKYEEPVSYKDISMPTEETLTESVGGYSIEDKHLGYDTEVVSHDSHPSQKSQQYFNDMIGRQEASVAKENNENSNADNISGLVQNYFKKNFDKHTFS